MIDARDYGVRADGTTDDTNQLQDAIDAAVAAGAGLALPGGTIKITSAIVVNNVDGLLIEGEGIQATILKAFGTFDAVLVFNSTGSGANEAKSTMVSHVTIDTTGYNTKCILINYSSTQGKNSFFDCEFRGDMAGNANPLFLSKCFHYLQMLQCRFWTAHASPWCLELQDYNLNSSFNQVIFEGSGNGVRITRGGGGVHVEGIRFTDCLWGCFGDVALRIEDSLVTTLANCVIDQFNDIGIEVEASAEAVHFSGGWIGQKAGATGSNKACVYFHEDCGTSHTFTGAKLYFEQYGFYWKATASVANGFGGAISGCQFEGTSNAKCAFRFDSVGGGGNNRTIIANNVDETSVSSATGYNGTYEISNTQGSGSVIRFLGNRVKGKGSSGSYNLQLTGSVVADNEFGAGLLSNSLIVSVSSTSSGSIAHGLVAAPAFVMLSMGKTSGSGDRIWVTSTDSTNINWATNANFTGTIYWSARVVA